MNIVRVFKNDQAFPGLLLVTIHDGKVARYETKGQATALYNQEEQVLGYNIAHMDYGDKKDGYIPMTDDLLTQINQAIIEAGFSPVVHDFTPRIIVGHVLTCEEHPDSDHLHVCQVDVGTETLQIVCGAHNVVQGAYVAAALEGAVMPDGKLIQNGKLRGEVSYGMLCSAWELGLVETKQKGLILLDDSYTIGASFFAERVKHHV